MALWHRVDYRIRQMIPWILMARKGPISAKRSIFQNYLSPTIPEIFWHSIRNRDFIVTATVLIANLLTLSTIISTGLLSLSEVPFTLTTQYRTTSKFTNDISQQLYESSLPGNIYDAIDTLNLPYPFGTTDRVAYQSFEPIDDLPGLSSAVQQAPVQVLSFDLNCQEANLTVNSFYYAWDNYCGGDLNITAPNSPTLFQNFSYTTPGCQISNVPLHYSYGDDQEIGNFAIFDFQESDCEGPSKNRVFFGIGQAQQQGVIVPWSAKYGCNETSPEIQIEVLKSKQWSCVPSMQYHQANVSFNSTTFDVTGLPEISDYWSVGNETLPSGVVWTLLASIDLSFLETDFQNGKPLPFPLVGTDNPNVAMYNGPEIRILRKAPNATMDEMLNTDLYATLSKNFFSTALAQVAHLWITADDGTPVEGIITVNRSRLKVSQPPLRAMQGILGLACLLLMFIIAVVRTKDVAPCDTGHIAGLAQVIKYDPTVRSLFSGTGSSSLSALMFHNMDSWQTSLIDTAPGKVLKFTPQQTHAASRESDPGFDNETKIEWWRPWTVGVLSRSIMYAFVICLIITSQILLALSNKNAGLSDIHKSLSEHYAWSLVPAALMTIVAIYTRALSSVYMDMAPYALLQRGAAATKSLCRNFQAMTGYEVLFHAAGDRQLGVFLITLATILSSFLTIVVSGMYTSVPVGLTFDISMERTTWFKNTNSTDNGTLDNSGVISGLILMANLSFPKWTYEDLSFATYQLIHNETENRQTSTNTSVQAILSAIRPSLNCTIYDQQDIPNLGYNTPQGIIQANFPGPDNCAGDFNNPYNFTNWGLDTVKDGKQIYFGGTLQNEAKGCPNLISIWGHHIYNDGKSNETLHNVTYAKAMSCYETIQQVDVDTTLTYPSLAVQLENPPVPMEETAKLFSMADIALPYNSMPVLHVTNSANQNFWSALLLGAGLNQTALGEANMTDTVAEAFKRAHKIVRAQQYHVALRDDLADASVPSTLGAAVTDWGTYRLVQDSVSTNILCGLLIAILLLSLISSVLINTRKVLPKNPSSIAASMSLLADSNIFDKDYLWYASAVGRGSTFAKNTNTKYRLGWFQRVSDMQRVYTIYADDAALEDYELKDAVSEQRIEATGHAHPKGAYSSVQQRGDGDSTLR